MTKRRGRPAYDDAPLLLQMAILLAKREVRSVRDAARRVAGETEGASTPAVIDRIRTKYAKHKADLEALAQQQLQPPPEPPRRRSSPTSAAKLDRTSLDRPSRDSVAKSYSSPATKLDRPEDHVDVARSILDAWENSAVGATDRYLRQRQAMLNSLEDSALDAVRKLLTK